MAALLLVSTYAHETTAVINISESILPPGQKCKGDSAWLFEAGLKPAINPKILALERPRQGIAMR